MRLAVLIPARNEEARLGGVIARVRAALPEAHLLVVDSESQDGTAALARELGAELVPQGYAGYAGALSTGYRALAGRGLDAVLQLDADGQHPPEEGARLVSALAEADLVIGSRAGTGSPGPLPRKVGNAVLGLAVTLATGRRLGDLTSGYQALGPRALSLFAETFPCCHADANVRVLALRRGLRVAEVPVRMAEREGGASMHDGLRGLRNFGGSLYAVLEERLARIP